MFNPGTRTSSPNIMKYLDNEIMKRTAEMQTMHNKIKDLAIIAKQKIPDLYHSDYFISLLDNILLKIDELAKDNYAYIAALSENLHEHSRYLILSHIKYYKHLLLVHEHKVLFICEELGVNVPRRFYE